MLKISLGSTMTESINPAHRFGMRFGASDMPNSAPGDATGTRLKLWAGESFEFSDLLDFVNPLQHLPGISYLYRELTGDKIGALARVVGGGILGGPMGAATSLVNALIESETGDDIGGHAIAFLTGEMEFPDAGDTSVQYASMSGRGADPWGDQAPASTLEGEPAAPDTGLAARETAAPTQNEALATAASPTNAPSMSGRGDDTWWRDTSGAASLASAATQPAGSVQTVDSKRRDAVPGIATGAPVMLAAAAPAQLHSAAPFLSPEPESDLRAPGPWIADAMSAALDRYQEMARARLETGQSIDAAY